MTSVPLTSHPTALPNRRKVLWFAAVIAAALLLGVSYLVYAKWTSPVTNQMVGAKFFPVAATDLQVKVSQEGELAAVNNIEVMSMVELGSTIVEIVKEGAMVKKGDTLVLLDSATIRQKIEDTSLDLQRAESDVLNSKELLQIQEGQNAANLEAAKVDLELANLSMEQYEKGTAAQNEVNARVAVETARITVANKEDDLRQVRELYAKNFVTLADVKTAELNLTTVKNDLAKAQVAYDLLIKYAHPMEMAGKKNYVAQSKQKLLRTEKENASNLAKAKSDVDTKEALLTIHRRRFARLQEQLEYCTIKAPADGLVVYAQRDRDLAPIQEGTAVRERQVLLRLPDTTAMKAVVKINENQVGRLKPGLQASVRITGIHDPVLATLTKISPVADSGSKWMNPDLREYPVELTLDATPPNLKPGIRVHVEILIDSIPQAMSVPLAALYAQGVETFVFVQRGESLEPRRVTLGLSNDTHAQIKSGLNAGEQVLLLQPGQGRDLLEKAGIQPVVADASMPKKKKGKGAPAVADNDKPRKLGEEDRPSRSGREPVPPDRVGERGPNDRPGVSPDSGGSDRPRGPGIPPKAAAKSADSRTAAVEKAN